MTALLPSIDPEQILARLRTDGATWFAPDFGVTGEHEDEESGIDETDSEIADGQEVERAELSDDGDDSAEVDAEYHDDESGDESDD